MRRAMLWFVLILILVGVALVSAQDELLRNPSLDEGSFGPYTTRRGGTFPIYLPDGWNIWLAQQSGDYYNRSDRTTVNPHPGPGPDPVQGNRAVNISCGYVTCTAALYQQVSVAEGVNLSASAYAQVKACNIAKDADNCGSAIESGSQTRIGIDPNGGTDPSDSDIIWSNWAQPHDQWKQMTVSATTTGTTATLFLYSTQSNPADLNRTYWDATSLKEGGEGGGNATPVPTAPPEVPFVVPQAPEPDGSLVHRVQPGDTIDSIAVAYGMSRKDVLALNPSISDPRIIRLGQEIVIREAPENATGGVNLEAEITEEPGAEGTAEVGGPEDSPRATPEAAEPDATPGGEPVEVADAGNTENTDEAAAAAEEATLTPAPVVEVADALPASSLATLNATVCVTLFNDTNQNRIQEPNETLLPGGGIAVTTLADGQVIESYETDGVSEPRCFEELAAGSYLIAASAPQGFGLTSPDQFRVQAAAGTRLDVAFGAAEGVQAVAPPPADAGGVVDEVVTQDTSASVSPLQDLLSVSGLVIFGLAAVVLVAGVGMTFFLRRR